MFKVYISVIFDKIFQDNEDICLRFNYTSNIKNAKLYKKIKRIETLWFKNERLYICTYT